MTEANALPRYDELPPASGGGRSGWGIFTEPNLGAFGLQTAERIVSAARLVRRGAMFALQAPMDVIEPAMFGRGTPRHTLIAYPGGSGFDDVIDNFYPQASSQWDGLAHVGYQPGTFYCGASPGDVQAGKLSMHHLAERGIAGRAVLLDAERVLADRHAGYHPSTGSSITPEDLETCREAAGVIYQPGDILLLNSGYLRWYRAQSDDDRATFAQRGRLFHVGIEHTERMAEYLWNSRISAIVSDLPATETWPPDESKESAPFGFLHRMLLGQLGIFIGELWHLQDLADDCRADGVYEVFLVSAPLNVANTVGSPANAIALK
ncbi:cyclase family protein [Nocardia sp. NPDC059246]|uniref:cyclase family protein n=1 Tax=unclassified Nocardia TaxID=2637762 RepID=UPI00369FE283